MLVKYFISPIFLHFWGHSISAVTRVSTFTFLPSVFNSSPGGSEVGDCDAINVFLHHQELHLNLFLPFLTTINSRFLSFFLLIFFLDSDCSLTILLLPLQPGLSLYSSSFFSLVYCLLLCFLPLIYFFNLYLSRLHEVLVHYLFSPPLF